MADDAQAEYWKSIMPDQRALMYSTARIVLASCLSIVSYMKIIGLCSKVIFSIMESISDYVTLRS